MWLTYLSLWVLQPQLCKQLFDCNSDVIFLKNLESQRMVVICRKTFNSIEFLWFFQLSPLCHFRKHGYTCDCHRALATGKFKKSHITTRNIKTACVATALSCWVAVAAHVVLWLIIKPDSTLGKSIVLQVNDHDPIMSPPMGNQHEYIKDSKRIAHNISRTILFPAL